MSKEEWKKSGTELGHAFTTFGKTFLRSAKTTEEKLTDWAEDREPEQKPENSTVYSDGSWKKTGKELGKAFAGTGKTLLNTLGLGDEVNSENSSDNSSENQSQDNSGN